MKWILYALTLVSICGCTENIKTAPAPNRTIVVDGEIGDWADVPENRAEGIDLLWAGQGIDPATWEGNDDLSFTWKAAWNGTHLYFLINVTDDHLSPFEQPFSWENDCVEIYIDPEGRGGERIEGVVADTPHEDRIGRTINGYEMHFLPTVPPKVYLDDTVARYRMEAPQNELFQQEWQGEIEVRPTSGGYLIEIGLTIPDVSLYSGKVMGVDIGLCDDDGNGRDALMLWSGDKGEFWITMDNFGQLQITD